MSRSRVLRRVSSKPMMYYSCPCCLWMRQAIAQKGGGSQKCRQTSGSSRLMHTQRPPDNSSVTSNIPFTLEAQGPLAPLMTNAGRQTLTELTEELPVPEIEQKAGCCNKAHVFDFRTTFQFYI